MSDTLIISVSGMRGHVGTDLTPELVARHAAALGAWARAADKPVVVVRRDARTSGAMFAHAAAAGLMSVGCDVIDLGMPTRVKGLPRRVTAPLRYSMMFLLLN